jgi:dienelactone hydrolase
MPAKLYAKIVPKCARGTRLGPWQDSDGTDRYACLYEPPQASGKPLPLVVYLHPSLLPADSVETWTNLLGPLATANVSNDPDRLGFVVLAPEGRNTHHYYAAPDASGPGWDNWYRQFSPDGDVNLNGKLYRENVDAAAIDHFIAAEINGGKIDRKRVYLTGWSNGGAMAYAYGLSRPAIAAIGVYSAPDPYELTPDPCPQTPVASTPANDSELRLFNHLVPNYQVHNNCDIAGICPNALFLEGQLRGLGGRVSDTIIDHDQNEVAACDPGCGTSRDGDLFNFNATTRGAFNHLRWPDHWTDAMLDFFRRHPLR